MRDDKTTIWRESDARFAVVVGERSDRRGYRVRSGWRGHPRSTVSEVDEALAVAIGQAIWARYQAGELEAPELAPETVGEFRDRLCARDDLSRATIRGYRQVWSAFAASVGEDKTIRRVYRLDIDRWLSAWTGTTRATYLRTIRAGIRWGMGQGWWSGDPTVGLTAVAPRRMGSWMPYDRWPAFLAHCTPAHRIRAAFALETGMRSGEIVAARWSWVQRGIGTPTIRVDVDPVTGFKPKWGSARAIPLTSAALKLLDDAREMWGDEGAIFGDDHLREPNFTRENRAACEGAGIPYVTFHALRRSAGAHWLDCGMSLLEVSRILGHRSIVTTERWYAGVGESTLARAMDQVEKRRGR